METHTEQIPRQDLPNEGSALPSGVLNHRGSALSGPSSNPMTTKRVRKSSAKPDHSATIAFAMEAANEVVADDALDELD